MKLLECQAKEIFRKFGIDTMPGVVVTSPDDIEGYISRAELKYPVAVKAQVPIGGRGKAGGIQFANNAEEAAAWANKLLQMDIRGYTASKLLIEEKLSCAQEFYISILLDRKAKMPLLMFSPAGGMDIEKVAREQPERIASVTIDPVRGIESYTIEYLISRTGADPALKLPLTELAEKMLAAFYAYHSMLIEINPLFLTAENTLIAADGKLEVDDNALYIGKLPDVAAWRDESQEDQRVKEARQYHFHFVPMEADGTVGIMSNGSGMMMSCLDLVTKKGMKVGCCLDQGGGATRERLREAVRIMFEAPNVRVLLVYIFGGITRCDEVCAGIQMALAELPEDRRVVVRLEGTNKEAAAMILQQMSGRVTAVDNISEAVEELWKLHQ